MTQSIRIAISNATPADAGLILTLIRELAEYEKLAHAVVATEADIAQALSAEKPAAQAIIAHVDGVPAGFALFFTNFSTCLGKPGLYLEDLFVRPAWRGQGIGKALLVFLAQRARARGYGRFEWAVLDWNEPALKFYRNLGAEPLSEWVIHRVAGAALDSLAGEGRPPVDR
jgi:GNAT superfamily N-acetyltransferase